HVVVGTVEDGRHGDRCCHAVDHEVFAFQQVDLAGGEACSNGGGAVLVGEDCTYGQVGLIVAIHVAGRRDGKAEAVEIGSAVDPGEEIGIGIGSRRCRVESKVDGPASRPTFDQVDPADPGLGGPAHTGGRIGCADHQFTQPVAVQVTNDRQAGAEFAVAVLDGDIRRIGDGTEAGL